LRMQSKNLRIGITGGIGSGKTLACRYLEKLGYTVICADIIAKQLYKSNRKIINRLVLEFGRGILDNNGEISGVNSRKVFFSGKKNIKRVNKIVHPFVIKEIEKLAAKAGKKAVFIETAIMFESGYYKKLDYVVLIYANKQTRVKRIQKRDKMSRADILKLMSFQMDEKEKMKRADFIIKNNSTQKKLYNSIKSFNKILTKL
jgi:dephospho-CoA kinase